MTAYLFVHQNFPGQFVHVAKALAERGNRVVAIGETRRLEQRSSPHPDIVLVGYPEPKGAGEHTHHYLRSTEAQIRRGQAVFKTAVELVNKGFNPDVVVSHPGWGESLFLKDAFPNAKHVHYLEYFYRSAGGDVGFDPEFPATQDDICRVRIKSATQLLGMEYADCGISPTAWQKSTYPDFWQSRITLLHDGIDCNRIKPDDKASLQIAAVPDDKGIRQIAKDQGSALVSLSRKSEVLTYVARNLEPYRGFHSFMRAIPELLEQRPALHILVVGGDEVSYGRKPVGDRCYRELYQSQWQNPVDLGRVHFLGKLAYADYLKVLQISSLHVYLTYPFVLSWSMLEAMSAGCLVLASDTAPVKEVIRHGQNGFLTDFFDSGKLAATASQLLADRAQHDEIRIAARATITSNYDLNSICLPAQLGFLA